MAAFLNTSDKLTAILGHNLVGKLLFSLVNIDPAGLLLNPGTHRFGSGTLLASLGMTTTTLEVLIDAQRIAARVQDIATQIREDLGDGEIVLIAVLKGCFPFIADLARAMEGDVVVDFMQTSSYGKGLSSRGNVQIVRDHDIDIAGRDVVIVEDIVDTGLTLQALRDMLGTRRPNSLSCAALLDKKEARTQDVKVEYTGFEIPNVFVVGYGLDHAERYRNLPYVAVLHQSP